MLFKDSTPDLEKYLEQRHRSFIIDSFGWTHDVLYILKSFDGELASIYIMVIIYKYFTIEKNIYI